MNYLAHAYLSFGNDKILAGNIISDFVKGKKQFEYSAEIQAGIKLHRAIDNFCDTHEATKQVKSFYSPIYRLYAAAFSDITYDYFLGNDKNVFENDSKLFQFSKNTYDLLELNKNIFPQNFAIVFPFMKSQNWLYHYRFEEGIQKSFEGMRRRSKYIMETENAYEIFNNNIDKMQIAYDAFFPEVKNFSISVLQELLPNVSLYL